ncbi:MAG TPA: hypothetical protein DDZ88_00900 [Verrucomicrobiales bacterium]|nr:hypothetical protein [Verrucomicrobiales bacterium]
MHTSPRHTLRLRTACPRCHSAALTVSLALSLIMLAPRPCAAIDVYISPTGSDTAAGTPAAPMQTLKTALDAVLRAGPATPHAIVIAPGTYTPTVPLFIKDQSDPAITITLRAADPAQPPVLDGSALPKVADSRTSDDALLTVRGGHFILHDLHFTRTPVNAVRVDGNAPLEVRRCIFSDIHGHAIRAAGISESVIDSCTIKDIDGTGIWIYGGKRGTLTPSGIVISNNHVSNVNRWSAGGEVGNGIYVLGVGTIVRHNTVENSVRTPWTPGIRVGGNNHLVEKNRLFHVSYGDCAAIYIGGFDLASRGNVVRFNYMEDCANGVYLDDRACGAIVTGNVIVKATNTGILIGGGQDNVITQNVVAQSDSFLRMDNRGMSWAPHQHPFKDDLSKLQTTLSDPVKKALYFKTFPTLATLSPENALLPFNNTVSDNYADGNKSGLHYDDYDKVLKGKHQRAYEKWNKMKEPRSMNFPKNKSLDLTRLGAPGLNTDQLGAQPPAAIPAPARAR